MAAIHTVQDLGGGNYRIIHKITRPDVNGVDREMPVNIQEMTVGQIDAEIARYESRKTDADNHITRLNQAKTIIAGL